MRNLRKLRLFEEYIESPDYKIGAFFKELRGQIKKWFEPQGAFGSQGCEIVKGDDSDDGVEVGNLNPMEKYLMFKYTEPEFQDKGTGQVEQFYYRVNFIVRLDQMKQESKINEADDPTSPQQDLLSDLGQTGDPAQTPPPVQGGVQGGAQGGEGQAEQPVGEPKNINIDKVLLKIQKYNSEDKVIKELVEEISVEDIKEDFIVNKIVQLEDSENKNDLTDNITQAQK